MPTLTSFLSPLSPLLSFTCCPLLHLQYCFRTITSSHLYHFIQSNFTQGTACKQTYITHSLIMQFSLLPISLFLSVAAAATSTSSAAASTSSVCAAQDVLNQCLITGQGYLDACASTDYACLCSKSNDILTYIFIPHSHSPLHSQIIN